MFHLWCRPVPRYHHTLYNTHFRFSNILRHSGKECGNCSTRIPSYTYWQPSKHSTISFPPSTPTLNLPHSNHWSSSLKTLFKFSSFSTPHSVFFPQDSEVITDTRRIKLDLKRNRKNRILNEVVHEWNRLSDQIVNVESFGILQRHNKLIEVMTGEVQVQ